MTNTTTPLAGGTRTLDVQHHKTGDLLLRWLDADGKEVWFQYVTVLPRSAVSVPLAERSPWPTTTKTITPATLDLLAKVAADAENLIQCNCSYDIHTTAPEDRCDGTCTHGMAVAALAALRLEVA